MIQQLKIGTRGSKMALNQTERVILLLNAAYPNIQCEMVIIKTDGDWRPEQGEIRLSEAAGGKGLFVSKIEEHLAAGDIDIAVHALKDVPTFLPDGFVVDCVLKRDDPRDAFISLTARSMDELPEGATIGTVSLRRQALILNRRPDIVVQPLRGNADTRMEKLRQGQVDAIILAYGGLQRLNLAQCASTVMSPEAMLPAAGQGAIAIETRVEDQDIRQVVAALHDPVSGFCCFAERAVLEVLDGSCRTPIGAFGEYNPETKQMRLRGLVASADGVKIYRGEETAVMGNDSDAIALGHRVGRIIKAQTPEAILKAIA